ncbi:hypothetical protein VNO78_10019 [Psophocarpus tetragonolobus]|uniref:Uncharacterized protein n=1 Tax=Psophocarpus tetragonolobus TaxID=3891 RepID=A0AAN9XM55_PSOTE
MHIVRFNFNNFYSAFTSKYVLLLEKLFLDSALTRVDQLKLGSLIAMPDFVETLSCLGVVFQVIEVNGPRQIPLLIELQVGIKKCANGLLKT